VVESTNATSYIPEQLQCLYMSKFNILQSCKLYSQLLGCKIKILQYNFGTSSKNLAYITNTFYLVIHVYKKDK